MSDQWLPPERGSQPTPTVPGLSTEASGSTWAAPPSAASPKPTKVPIVEMPTAGTRIGAYLEDLASDAPTPGGGAWAAVSAAAGASLIAMVARLTVKKKGFEDVGRAHARHRRRMR